MARGCRRRSRHTSFFNTPRRTQKEQVAEDASALCEPGKFQAVDFLRVFVEEDVQVHRTASRILSEPTVLEHQYPTL